MKTPNVYNTDTIYIYIKQKPLKPATKPQITLLQASDVSMSSPVSATI